MKNCIDCGMPMLAPEDFAGGNPESDLCVHCGSRRQAPGAVINYAVFQSVLGKADDVFAFLEDNLRQTRAFEGLLDAFISQDRQDPGRFLVMSKWTGQAAYDEMQQAFADTGGAPSWADIRHMLACDPVMGTFTIIR